MTVRLAACLLFAGLLGIAAPARAVEMNPGDSRAGFASGVYRPTGGQENPNGALVVCDGSVWQPILRYSSAGNAVMFSSTGLPAAPVHVWGEAIIGNQGLACGAEQEGALRYTSSSDTWEYCDGAGWLGLASGSGGSGDNLGDHTATQNLLMSGFWVSNDGDNEGVFVDTAGNAGVGTSTPQSKLDVNGEVQVGDSGVSCTSSNEGAQRYNSTAKAMEFCDGSSWQAMGGTPIQVGTVTNTTGLESLSGFSAAPFVMTQDAVENYAGFLPAGVTSTELDVSNAVRSYSLLDSFAAPGNTPHGLTWDGTNFWVSSFALFGASIYKLDTAGNVLDSFGPPDNDPGDMAWDGSNLWVIDDDDGSGCGSAADDHCLVPPPGPTRKSCRTRAPIFIQTIQCWPRSRFSRYTIQKQNQPPGKGPCRIRPRTAPTCWR